MTCCKRLAQLFVPCFLVSRAKVVFEISDGIIKSRYIVDPAFLLMRVCYALVRKEFLEGPRKFSSSIEAIAFGATPARLRIRSKASATV